MKDKNKRRNWLISVLLPITTDILTITLSHTQKIDISMGREKYYLTDDVSSTTQKTPKESINYKTK